MPMIIETPQAVSPIDLGGLTFLELCRRLRRQCRVAGNGPVKVTGQNEEYSRLIDWINQAWMDIQLAREDWAWMRAPCTFFTVPGKAVYSPSEMGITDFGNWTRYTWRNFLTSAGQNGEMFMDHLDYEVWRDVYQFGAYRTTLTQPLAITITPDQSIGLGPTPLGGYTVIGDYYRAPSELIADGDIPVLPARFHMLIVYRAMMFYGASEAASEVYATGEKEFNRMMNRLERNQLPEITMPGALC